MQAEERELTQADGKRIPGWLLPGGADTKNATHAMAALAAQQRAAQEAKRLLEKELAAVKVDAADVQYIATEFELDKKSAERRLRECSGDLRAALESLLERA